MTWLLIVASLAVLIAALLLRRRVRQQQARTGFSDAPVYSDTGEYRKILVSSKYELTGKPDHILKVDGALIPVERKSRALRERGRPHEGEVLQLAAYCLLVQEHFGVSVERGKLQYANRTIEVPFDDILHARLLAALESIRESRKLPDVHRSHNHEARCRACGFRASCGEALVSASP